jgi:hypothetical protein
MSWHLQNTQRREGSVGAPQTALDQLAHSLNAAGVLVVWIGPHELKPNRTLRLRWRDWAFASGPASGTCCANGVAVCARRLESNPVAKVA